MRTEISQICVFSVEVDGAHVINLGGTYILKLKLSFNRSIKSGCNNYTSNNNTFCALCPLFHPFRPQTCCSFPLDPLF